MRMVPLEHDAEAEDQEDGFDGLEEVHEGRVFDIADERSPRLCFAGPAREAQHLDGCPHTVAWQVYKDEL